MLELGMKTKFFLLIIPVIFCVILPVAGQQKDQRNTPITVNLIIEGGEELKTVINDVIKSLSDRLVDGILQNGDYLTIWSAGKTAQILYEDTIKSADDKVKIKKILRELPSSGDSVDFQGALQKASSKKTNNSINYIMLISASYKALSSTVSGSSSQLFKYSKVEEYRGWRSLIIAPAINDIVSKAASVYMAAIQ